MTIVPTVPLMFLVSVAVSLRCFGDSSAHGASGVLEITILFPGCPWFPSVFLCCVLVTLVPDIFVSTGVSVRCLVNSVCCPPIVLGII